jgi:hypothetical protein
VIVLAQVYDDVQRRTMDGIRNALRREGLEYLDYTELMNPRDPRFRLAEHDYHYSAAANRIIAQRLAADLLQTSAAVNLLPSAGAPEPTSHVAGIAAARISD